MRTEEQEHMHNTEFAELIKQDFEKVSKSSFLKKVKIVNTTEDKIPENSGAQLFIADNLITDKPHGTFEIVSTNFPNIKSGVRLKDQDYERMVLTANNLAISCTHRLNALLSLYVCGGGELGHHYVKMDTPVEVHSVVDDIKNGIGAIKAKLEYMEALHGAKYDRLTLNGVLLTLLTGEIKVVQAKKMLKEATGLKIDVDNGYYNVKPTDGNMVQHNYVPNNKLIFSNSKNDNSDLFYFANLPISDEVVTDEYGVTGYVKDDTAWAVVRGVPVLADKTAFSTITFK